HVHVMAQELDLLRSERFARGHQMQADRLPQPIQVLDGDVLLAVDGLAPEAVEQIDVVEAASSVVQRLLLDRDPLAVLEPQDVPRHRTSSHSTVITRSFTPPTTDTTTPTSRPFRISKASFTTHSSACLPGSTAPFT